MITDPITIPPKEGISFSTSPEGDEVIFVVHGGTYETGVNQTPIGESITFTADTSNIEDVVRYEWDFGDGKRGYGNPVEHTYVIPNPHLRAKLRVISRDGTIYSVGKQIYLADEAPQRIGAALWWALDNITGTTDLSGNGRNGTGAGSITIGNFASVPPGFLGGNLSTEFDGTDDRITSTFDPFVDSTTRTYVGWALRDTSTTADCIFGSDSTTPLYFGFLAANPTGLFFTADNFVNPVTFASVWPGNGVWGHWALTFDEGANTIKLHVNGALVSSQSYSIGHPPGNVKLGASGTAASSAFDGKMADFAIYTRALSTAEIAALYNQGPSATVDRV